MFLNSLDSNLQFTIEIGGSELCFLDLKLTSTDNKIQTTVYSKPTDSHLYLQADSCHHLPSILEIQKGVVPLRLRRICSNDEEYNNKSKEYKAYLTGRGHKLKNIEKSFNDVLNMSRQQSCIKKTKKRKILIVKIRLFFEVSIIPWDRISRTLFKSMLIFLTIVK